MQVAAQKVVTLEYTLKDDQGEILDSSEGAKPLVYLHGQGSLVAGLEKALDNKGEGDSFEITVPPEDAYGTHNPALIQRMQMRRLPDKNVQVGMRFRVQMEGGARFLLVTAIQGDYATVDANHPLVGMTLHFSVKVVAVRDATAEELAHGHVHGADGHAH